jgi:hypothetical protein
MKIVKEHINEKFELDSDPIHDMGIGVPIIKIKVGSIVKIKKVGLYSHFNRHNKKSEYDITLDKGGDLPTYYIGFVMKKHIEGNKMFLQIAFYGMFGDDVIKHRDAYLKYKKNVHHLIHGIATLPILTWNEYLEIVE